MDNETSPLRHAGVVAVDMTPRWMLPFDRPPISPDRRPLASPRTHSNRDRYLLGAARSIARARWRDVSLSRRAVGCDLRFSSLPRRHPRRRRRSSRAGRHAAKLPRRVSPPHRHRFQFTRHVAAQAKRRHWHARCFLRPCERHRPGACHRFCRPPRVAGYAVVLTSVSGMRKLPSCKRHGSHGLAVLAEVVMAN
jgi:hypothetical protein